MKVEMEAMPFTKYYVTSDRKMLARLAKRLMFIQEPFSYNGGRTIQFEISDDRKRWIVGTLQRLAKDCENEGVVFEIETYKSK